jgi:hypothetical protein
MRHFTITVAAVGIAALVGGAPASAQHQPGGPIKQGTQCWKHHGAGSDHQFGSMETCAQPASAPAVRRAARPRT